jgi:hypothetical protein
MWTETIEARGHTTADGVLNLSVNVGVADADVSIVMRVKPASPEMQWTNTAGPWVFLTGSLVRCQSCIVRRKVSSRKD